MKATKAHQPLPDHDAELENDAVWSLLEQGTQAEPSPQFTQNTLRAARLQNEKTTTSWWQKIFTPKPIIASDAAENPSLLTDQQIVALLY